MAKSITIPAATRGWNTVDSIAQMPVNQAFILDNLIPSTSSVINRAGYSSWATGIGVGNVDSIYELKAAAVNKFIAAGDGAFYDISTTGPGTLIKNGFTSNQWDEAVFNGQLGLVNGNDDPQTYDGTTMSNMVVSGPADVTKINVISTFKNRTYFALVNSQSFWYSALNTLGGVLTEFPLGRVGNFGGNLIAIQTLTRDGGTGQEDQICFFMSSGEIIVYQGTDPGANFVLVGVFKTGRPINSRSIIKFGADIFFATNEGYLTMSDLLPLSYGKTNTALNQYIKGAAVTAVTTFGSSFGWEAILSPSNSFLMVNVPQSNNTFIQHVVDINTLSWCRFTGINARCWYTFGNDLYFGGTNGNVYKYGGTFTDDGSQINSIYQSGYIKFTSSVVRTTAFRPRLQFDSSFTMGIQSSIDFKPFSAIYTLNYGSVGAFWGDPWGTAWAAANAVVGYINLNNVGYSTSIKLTFTSPARIEFLETDFLFEKGSRI